MGLEAFNGYECDGQLTFENSEKRLTHLSLFTGIGGLDLAAEWAGFQTVGQCEWSDYPTKVLEKHWPDVPRWRDVHGLSADEFFERTGIGPGELTCISGGFPCQPHSVAGLRKASSDERDLWPEYRRVVSEIKPRWVVAENVRGLLSSENGRFLGRILRDFSDLGYDVGWCCYRAADVGAIHSRERIAIIAYSRSQRLRTGGDNREGRQLQSEQRRNNTESESKWSGWEPGIDKDIKANADSYGFGLERMCKKSVHRERNESPFYAGRDIEEWSRRSNLFEPKLLRTYNGVPGQVDRIKCLGNAVVPQQFYPIFKAIAEVSVEE